MNQTMIVVTFPPTQVPERQEEEKVYRFTIDDHETLQNSAPRNQQHGRLNLQSTARRVSSSQMFGRNTRVSIGNGSQENRRR